MSSVPLCPVAGFGPCIGNFQPGQLGSRHYNTVDVNKQLVHAREKQLCGCITRFSTFLWRPPHDYDVKLANHFTGDIKTEFFCPSLSWARFLRINKLLANWAGLKSFKNREMKHRVYDKRGTWICTWWPCFPFTYRLLFIITTGKPVDSRKFFLIRLFLAVFICSFLILKISQVESHFCSLP